jgi:preprotein translocase subunit SecY
MKSELARRIGITIGALLIFRLGTFIPLPGITPQNAVHLPASLGRISILSLSLLPYLSAAIIIQLVSLVWRRLNALERSGEAGRRRIAWVTLALTLPLVTFQAFGVANAVQSIRGLVPEPGGWFLLSTTASMVGGVFFLIWLSEQITRYGIGNGLAVILSVGIITLLPAEFVASLELVRQGAVSTNQLLFDTIFWLALVPVIVLVESARRNVPVQYAARQVGRRLLPPRTSVLPIKLNSAGFLIPTTVMPWIIFLPLAAATFGLGQTPWLAAAYGHMHFARPAHIIVGVVLGFVLAFIYTAYVLDPERAAETLREQGGAIPGVAPGEPTADHLDRVVSLTTIVGAGWLVAISFLPEALVAGGVLIPYKMGGGSALIVVCTILDIRTQVRDLRRAGRGGERL